MAVSPVTALSQINGFKLVSGVPSVAVTAIKEIAGYNVRDAFSPATDASDAELLASIKANGFIADKPVVIRIVGADAYLIAGHRRLAAVQLHNETADKAHRITHIAITAEAKSADGTVRDAGAMALDLLLSNNGKPLSPAEKGAAFMRMKEAGANNGAIAARAGVSEKWVRDCMGLTRLDPRLKALVKAGTIPPTMAKDLAGAHGPDKAVAIVEEAAKAAPKAGKKAGKVTDAALGAAETKVTGKPAKVATGPKVPGAKPAAAKPAAVTTPPAKAGWLDCLAGPFRAGKGDDDCAILDATGDTLAEAPDAEQAAAMVRLMNQGWQTFRGTSNGAVPVPVPVKPTAKPAKRAAA